MLKSNDHSKLKEILEGFSDKGTIETSILKNNGSVFYGDVSYKIPPEVFSSEKEVSVQSGKKLLFFKPLLNEEGCIKCHSAHDAVRGVILVEISTEETASLINGTIKGMVAFASVMALISGLSLIFIVRRMVINPLGALKAGIDNVRDGQYFQRVDIKGNDEFGALAFTFNDMAERIENSKAHLEHEVAGKTKDLRVIAGLSTKVFRGDLAIDDIIDKFLDSITDEIGYSFCTICFIDRETGLLIQEYTKGHEENFCASGLKITDNHPFTKALIETKTSVQRPVDLGFPKLPGYMAIVPIVSHTRKRCREANLCKFTDCPAYDHPDERCWLIECTRCRSRYAVQGIDKLSGCFRCPAFPLIGVLVAGSESGIDESSIHSIEILASEIAASIENFRLIDRQKRNINELIRLHDISVESIRHLNIAELSASIVSYAASFSGSEASILWFIDDKWTLTYKDSFKIEKDSAPHSLDIKDCFIKTALINDDIIETVEPGEFTCLKDMMDRHGFRYAATIPLKSKDIIIGCLTLFKNDDFLMTDSQKAVIMLYASQAASALENARLYEALRNSEGKYRALINDASDGIALFDTDGYILEINRKAMETIGYAKEELIGAHFSKYVPAKLHKKTLESFGDVQKTGYSSMPDLSLRRKDGGEVAVDATGSFIEYAGKKIIQVIFRDISELSWAEGVLRTIVQGVSGETGEAFFRTLVQYLAETLKVDYAFIARVGGENNDIVSTIAVYAHGEITENFKYNLKGSPCENVVGKSIASYPGGVQKLFPDDYLLVKMGIEGYIGTPLSDSSGNPLGIMVILSCRPIDNPKIAESMLQIFAIRASSELERKIAEEAIREQKEFSDAIFNNVASGVMVLDLKGKALRINPSASGILDIPTESIEGRDITGIYPELRKMLVFGKNIDRETNFITSSGVTKPIGFANSPLFDSSGREMGIIVVFRDLTEIKKLQSELRRKQHFEAMAKVISGVAHEVRNPLFGIQSIGQILEREIESPAQTALIQAMLKETGRMKNLIEELLLLSRPSKLNPVEFDIGLFFEEIKNFTSLKGHLLAVKIDAPHCFTLNADRDKLKQVFLNLINNSIDSKSTGVNITATPDEKELHIIFEDNGAGINEQAIEKIFDPFFTTKKEGTGLGLSICKKIVEEHGGNIELKSTENCGATVFLTLPYNPSIKPS
jgi:PAS domain S-box-containing protein